MARELKVWCYTLATYGDESERLGQRSHVRQCKAIVATATKKEAIEKFGITQSEAAGYLGAPTGNEADIKQAMSKPGQVFAYPLNGWSDEKTYIEIERTPHVPRKRAKRVSHAELMARWAQEEEEQRKREFTDEELQYMADMFAGANNPVAASIAERAKLILSTIPA